MLAPGEVTAGNRLARSGKAEGLCTVEHLAARLETHMGPAVVDGERHLDGNASEHRAEQRLEPAETGEDIPLEREPGELGESPHQGIGTTEGERVGDLGASVSRHGNP